MPSVQWLLFAVIAICSPIWFTTISAEHSDLPVASNGWRPIIGNNYNQQSHLHNQNYQNNNANSKPDSNGNFNKNTEEKKNNQGTHNFKNNAGGHIRVNHHGSSGLHGKHNIPSKPLHMPTSHGTMHMMSNKMSHRLPPPTKMNTGTSHLQSSSKRQKVKQPMRNQHTSHNNREREELIAPAPSSAIGSYAYFNQGPFNIRDTQIGDRNKQFSSAHHGDFNKHFNLQTSNNDVTQHLTQNSHFTLLPKHPSQNELSHQYIQFFNQNDEFTRNLVPPPPSKQLSEIDILKDNVNTKEQSILISNGPHFLIAKPKPDIGQIYPENVVVQLPQTYGHFPTGDSQLNLEITREKFREFHTTLAPSYSPTTESYSTLKYTNKVNDYLSTKNHGYEVTEDKPWQEQNLFYRPFLTASTPYKQVYPTLLPEIIQNTNNYVKETSPFLPTPLNTDNVFPTSPTQGEISSIYSEVSQLNRKKNYNDESSKYNIKHVATHLPIYDIPKQEVTQILEPIQHTELPEYTNEVTTKKYIPVEEIESTEMYIRPTQQSSQPTRGNSWKSQRNRQNPRRRRPTRPSTTEQYDEETEIYQTTARPQRRRRPQKYRTTEATPTEEVTSVEPTTRPTYSVRRKTTRHPQTVTEEVYVSANYRSKVRKTDTEEQESSVELATHVYDAQHILPTEEHRVEESSDNHFEYIEPTTEYSKSTESRYMEERVETTARPIKRKRIRTTTTEILPSTNLKTPENELDYTTIAPYTEEPITIREAFNIFEQTETEPSEPPTTLITSTSTTTTTETPTTTKSNRLRRPIKYDTHRPRFSVKDYRQRLTQYTSTSTESNKSETPRIKYPSRFSKVPTGDEPEDNSEVYRLKFKPKDPRHRPLATEGSNIDSTTEKYRSTRVRPLARQRTTESFISTTATPKILIKPNIFSNLKRPQHLSLRNRIQSKKNSSTTTESNYDSPDEEETTEKTEVTITEADNKMESTTEAYRRSSVKINTSNYEIKEDLDAADDAEAFLQLQRISDLTSSAKNSPGFFKAMSSTSRKVPNYFTISTDDPILPIEAFFSKVNS